MALGVAVDYIELGLSFSLNDIGASHVSAHLEREVISIRNNVEKNGLWLLRHSSLLAE